MSLREACEHGRYDEHRFLSPGGDPESSIAYQDCDGGRVLSDAEALRTLLPEVDVGRVRFLVDRLNRTAYDDLTTGELRMLYDLLLAVLDALGGSDE